MSVFDSSNGRQKIQSGAENLAGDIKRGAQSMEHEASEMADAVKHNASELADTVSTKLKSVGVDTEVMANMAKDQVSDLQKMIGQELQAHPMRTLGIAAAVGVFVGLMTVR